MLIRASIRFNQRIRTFTTLFWFALGSPHVPARTDQLTFASTFGVAFNTLAVRTSLIFYEMDIVLKQLSIIMTWVTIQSSVETSMLLTWIHLQPVLVTVMIRLVPINRFQRAIPMTQTNQLSCNYSSKPWITVLESLMPIPRALVGNLRNSSLTTCQT